MGGTSAAAVQADALPPGNEPSQAGPRAVDDARLRVCLERTVELAPVRVRVRDWPGRAGPLLHVPDPGAADDSLVDALAATFQPRYRILSLAPRDASPYQVAAADLLGVLDQFGWLSPVLVAERLGCVAALVAAAWHVGPVAGLVLVEPTADPPPGHGLVQRALRDCPPDWTALRAAVECPVLEVARGSALRELEEFLARLAPGVT